MSDLSVRMKLEDDVSNKLQKISAEARKASSEMKNAGQAMDNAFKSSAPESFASQAGEAMESVSSGAESLGESISEAFSGLGGEFNEFQDSANNLGDAMDEISRSAGAYQDANGRWHDANGKFIKSTDEAAKAARSLGEAAEDAVEPAEGLGESVEGAGNSMGEAEGKANSFSGAIKGLIAAVAGAKVVSELKDFIGASVDIGKDFTSMMSEVGAISGASGSQLAQLEQTARDYGATTVFSATEAAEALKYMSLAGWDANQSSAALGGVLNLAAASGMGLGQASDMVTDYLSAFGMQASESTYFADMLAYAQSNSNATAEQLGEAYRNSAANMHAAGQDVETTTSLLEAMANQGYKGSEAGTALAATMRDITQKMDNGAIKIGDTSIAVQDAQGNFRDLTDILTDVEDATDGMGGAQKAAALGSTFTADSIRALNMVLAEGMDTVAGYEEELRSAAGTSEDMAATMNDNLTGDMANMSSAFEEMQLQVFEGLEEPLRGGTQYITNEVIPILTGWLPDAIGTAANGIGKLGNAVKPLFETVLKNPKAIAETFTAMGTGILAFKVANAAGGFMKTMEGVDEIGGALQKIVPAIFSHPWAAGAAAVTAALAGIGFAIDAYNDKQISNSLEEHFGNVQLSAEQVTDVASNILSADYLVNINAALGEFENADKLRAEAEAALQDNDALEWKCRVGISLTPEEQQDYLSNIESYVKSSIGELESRTYAANLTVSTMLTSPEGQSLADSINKWAAEDMADVSLLSGQLTNLVQDALTDGMIDVNEQAAIDILQGKINNIMSGWQDAQAQAEMDLLTQKYGRMSGKDLTEDTFTSIVSELGEQRTTAMEALDASQLELYGVLNGLESSGRITSEENQMYHSQAGEAYRNSQAEGLMNSVNFESNTLSDTYGEKLEANFASMQESTQKSFDNMNGYLQNQDYGSLSDALSYGFNQAMTSTGLFSDGDQKALSQLYETMKPDTTALGEMIDTYAEAGQAVPQQVMDSFNEAMQIGAAAGDADAAWQVFANQMVADPANKALVDAIDQGTVQVPEELRSALERATVETTDEPITIDGMKAELQDVEVDDSKVEGLLTKALEGLEATGETATINGTATVEYKVTAGDTLSGIAEKAGIAIDELLAVNEIENPNVINVGQKINIPSSAVEVDASGVGEAAGEIHSEAQAAADSVTSEPVTSEQQVDKVLTPGETDASQVTSQTQGELDSEFEAPLPTSGTADVTITKASDNIPEVYSQVGSELKSAFATTFPVETSASIHVNYSIANPTANISFSGGGTGSAAVSASLHADGGRFSEPHLGIVAEAGYPEYIIPMDGSDNAESLWRSAGEEMGLMDKPISETPVFATAPEGGSSKESASNGGSRDINLNINGNGKMTIGSNMSKEDVLNILLENVKDALLGIIEQEILEEGDGVYEY